MTDDILKRIEQDFGQTKDEAISSLEIFEKENGFGDRVSRCIIHLSKGDLNELYEMIEKAKVDWRDVIAWAEEYDFQFREPFD